MYFNLKYLAKHKCLFPCVIGITYSQFKRLLPKFSLGLRRHESKHASRFNRLREIGGGRKPHLRFDWEKLFFILFYYKVYPTFRFAQVLFQLDKRNCQIWVRRLEHALFDALGYQLTLSKAKARINGFVRWFEVVPQLREFLVDATERTIRRPKDADKQEFYYSGKKKRHTVKNQILVSPKSKRILAVSDTYEGKRHDKKIFEEDPLFLTIPPKAKGLGDSAYQGVTHPFLRLVVPVKKPPGGNLSEEMKQNNHAISSIRVRVEHPISYLKHFNILSQTFRGNIKYADLPFKTISAIYNFTRTKY